MKPKPTPEFCPVCEADVPPHAKACPQCGACHESGWDEDAEDEDEFDYNDWLTREEGRKSPRLHPAWVLVAAVLLVWMIYLLFF